ncbi:MAG: flavodoxin-dependent (E)-4-hydroxy-3-methylbut-2-enyl-diphosphate synthase, partial [Oscillospiraceae bacterium]
GNVRQARELERLGCQIIRVSVPDREALKIIPALKEAVSMPVAADIHFDYRMAIESVEAGADKIRINPGNIGSRDRIRAVVRKCAEKNVPIRVGVNSGSLEKEVLAKHGGPDAEALAESALNNVKILEDEGFGNIVISAKSSDVGTMIKANRIIAASTTHPLHIGVTESGLPSQGLVKSAIGIGSLLADGIGDTIRVSLTGSPDAEIDAAKEILRAVGKFGGVEVISCPTCGRTEIDVEGIASEVEKRTRGIDAPLKVAVMGCVVNGPGEASQADVGIAGGKDCAVLFKKGKMVRKLTGGYVDALMEEVEAMAGAMKSGK